jgi:hypothetical protein
LEVVTDSSLLRVYRSRKRKYLQMNARPEITSECLAPNGGALQVRTGRATAPAQPLWHKALKQNRTREQTSEMNNSGRYFFGTRQPGYLAGFNYVHQLSHPQLKLKPTNPSTVGFFDDTIDPAFAGSINVPTNHLIPTLCRDFSCTRSKPSGDYNA